MSKQKGAHAPHIIPLQVYLGIGSALLFLTIVTVLVAQVHLGPFNLIVAMAIATIKASLVAMVFMHLFYDNKFYLMIFLSSLLFLSVFISITLLDTLRRDDIKNNFPKPAQQQVIVSPQTADQPAKAGTEGH